MYVLLMNLAPDGRGSSRNCGIVVKGDREIGGVGGRRIGTNLLLNFPTAVASLVSSLFQSRCYHYWILPLPDLYGWEIFFPLGPGSFHKR